MFYKLYLRNSSANSSVYIHNEISELLYHQPPWGEPIHKHQFVQMCVYVHVWQGHPLYQPLLDIHSFSLNKQINQYYRCNTFLLLSVCSVLLLPASQPGVWVAQGQEGGKALRSLPVPCDTASISGVGPLPWCTPRRTEWGRWHATHAPSSPCHHPVEAAPAATDHGESTGGGPLQCLPGRPSLLLTQLGAAHGAAVPEARGHDKSPGYLHNPGTCDIRCPPMHRAGKKP